MTVQQVLDAANRVLGGCDVGFSASEINECVTRINENFTDGEVNGGFLGLP